MVVYKCDALIGAYMMVNSHFGLYIHMRIKCNGPDTAPLYSGGLYLFYRCESSSILPEEKNAFDVYNGSSLHDMSFIDLYRASVTNYVIHTKHMKKFIDL